MINLGLDPNIRLLKIKAGKLCAEPLLLVYLHLAAGHYHEETLIHVVV